MNLRSRLPRNHVAHSKVTTGLLGLALVSLTLQGCASEPDAHPGVQQDNATVSENGPDELLFAQDLRPADGPLTEVRLGRDESGRYEASFRTVVVGFGAPPNDTTTLLGVGLACEFHSARVVCSRDDRVADGTLTVVELQASEAGTWSATLRTVFFDPIAGRQVDETKTVAVDLHRTR